jgi:hypothetical protein
LIELSQLTLARTSAIPFRIEPPATLTLVKGYPTEVPVKLIRDKGPSTEKLAIAVTAVVPGPPAGPTGFALRPAAASAAAEACFSITPGVNVPEGVADLAVTATARVGPQQFSLAAPVAVTIQAPFAIQVGVMSPLKLPPGETVKLTGKVVREAVFKGPVRLTLAGLPAGVSLVGTPTVAATASDFAIELRINPKAAPAKGTLTLTAQAAVNGMNYTAPVASVEAVVGK